VNRADLAVIRLGEGNGQIDLGGKAANLDALIGAGFPVPAGFVVPPTAFDRFIATNNLQDLVAAQTPSEEARRPTDAWHTEEDVRALIVAASIPSELGDQICAAYRALVPGNDANDLRAVAVRSSATGEDSTHASFAGQLDSFLNVRDEAALLDAVKQCWASLWTARAIGYRAARAPTTPLSQAVVVQRMVHADCAGVLFTANPVSGSEHEIVINAAFGLGDAVVAGTVTPDVVVVDKHAMTITRMETARNRGTERATQDAAGAVLTSQQAVELARIGRAIELHFGCPQDIEWAIEGRTIWILQARPVTAGTQTTRANRPAAPSVPSSLDPEDDDWPTLDQRAPLPFDYWTLANVGELWTEPVSPIVASTVPSIIGGALRHSLRGLDPDLLNQVQWAKRWFGRVYYNEGALTHALSHQLGLPGALFDRSRGHRVRTNAPSSRFRLLPFLRRLPTLLRLASRHWVTGTALQHLVTDIDRSSAEFRARSVFLESDHELWLEIDCWFEQMKHALNLQNDMSGYSLAHFAIMERLIGRWAGDTHLAHDLVSGLSDIETADIGPALAEVSQALREAGLADVVLDNHPRTALDRIRSDPRSAGAVRLLDHFLERHGHRCANDAEWLHPRWIEAPEEVIEMAAAYLRLGDAVNPAETARRQQQHRIDVTSAISARLNPLQRFVFRLLLSRTQYAVRYRDNGKNAAMKAAYPARRLVFELGRRWCDRKWLSDPEDIFFLTVLDLKRVIDARSAAAAGLDLMALVTRRRRAHAYWFDQPSYEAVDAAGQPIAHSHAGSATTDTIHGIAASTGRVRGRARVVHHPREALRLGAGEILVTHATDTGWSAVFPIIGGLVTEIGGQLSHAAILAREYGLPAVVNVDDATRRIADGQTISIDGGSGVVHLHQSAIGKV
jgi:pyruvate,water dikinase